MARMNRNQRNLLLTVTVSLLLLLYACKGATYNWGWYEILPSTDKGASNLRFLFSGIWLTVALSVISIVCSVIIGLFVSFPGLSMNPYLKWFNRILPPLGNQFVYMLKMSSLLSIIGLQELTRKANELTVTVYRPLEIYTILVLEYLILILLVSWLVRWLEAIMGGHVQTANR